MVKDNFIKINRILSTTAVVVFVLAVIVLFLLFKEERIIGLINILQVVVTLLIGFMAFIAANYWSDLQNKRDDELSRGSVSVEINQNNEVCIFNKGKLPLEILSVSGGINCNLTREKAQIKEMLRVLDKITYDHKNIAAYSIISSSENIIVESVNVVRPIHEYELVVCVYKIVYRISDILKKRLRSTYEKTIAIYYLVEPEKYLFECVDRIINKHLTTLLISSKEDLATMNAEVINRLLLAIKHIDRGVSKKDARDKLITWLAQTSLNSEETNNIISTFGYFIALLDLKTNLPQNNWHVFHVDEKLITS